MAHSHTPGPVGAAGLALVDGTIVIDAAGLVDGRDPSVDGAKLDLIEAQADVTDAANVAAAGAGMLAVKQAWTASQAAGRTALTVDGTDLKWDADTAKQHLSLTVTAGKTVNAPTGTLVPDTPYFLAIVCDATNDLTWAGIYDWGGAAHDFSGVTAGKIIWVAMLAWSATRIHLSADLTKEFSDSP